MTLVDQQMESFVLMVSKRRDWLMGPEIWRQRFVLRIIYKIKKRLSTSRVVFE